MTSVTSRFKYIPRGFKETLVFIPGWAADYRIFSSLSPAYNYLLPIEFCPFDFEKTLAGELDKLKPDKVTLFGWSLGACLAYECAVRNPDRFSGLYLIGMRQKYEEDVLGEIARKVRRNAKAYLYKFYCACFSPTDTEGAAWFNANLMKEYLDGMTSDYLCAGLEYLARVDVREAAIASGVDVRIFHGAQDTVAPCEEAAALAARLPQAVFTALPGLGHLPFLNKEGQILFS